MSSGYAVEIIIQEVFSQRNTQEEVVKTFTFQISGDGLDNFSPKLVFNLSTDILPCVHLALAGESITSITCHPHLKGMFDGLFRHILLEVASSFKQHHGLVNGNFMVEVILSLTVGIYRIKQRMDLMKLVIARLSTWNDGGIVIEV